MFFILLFIPPFFQRYLLSINSSFLTCSEGSKGHIPMWNSMVDGGFAFPLVNTLGFREGRYLCGIDLLFFMLFSYIQPFFFLSSLHHLTIVMAVFTWGEEILRLWWIVNWVQLVAK